jgi:hypothetical protein
MSTDLSTQTNQVKGFWSRPEGVTGMLTVALLGVGGLILLQQLLPILLGVMTMGIAVVGKGIVLAVLCSILALILFIVTNKKFQTLVSYIFKSAMRKATALVVEIDPIGIMKNYIGDLKTRLGDMDNSISKLNGQISICRSRVAKMDSDHETAIKTAKIAHEQDKASLFTVNARQAGRLEKSSVTLKQLQGTLELHLRALRKYREVSETVILDMTNEVEVRQIEREAILSSYSAIRSAMSILNGDPDKKELFDQAMEFVVNDYGMKVGEIENFMINSKSFVEGLDLQNGVFEADALLKIQAWESKADSILLGDDKKLMLENFAGTSARQPVTVDNEYDSFFKK